MKSSPYDQFGEHEGLAPFPEDKNKLPESRICDVQAAHRIYVKDLKDDELSSRNRAMVDAAIEGEAPFDQQALIDSGNAHRYNLNFLEGDAAETAALTSYTDLIDSVSCMVSVKLEYNTGDAIERDEAEEVIAEEFHELVREWAEFDGAWELLARRYIRHGIAITYFPDDSSPWWRVGGLDEFRFPRQTLANEDKIPVLSADVPYEPHELYALIKDEEAATKMGWNVEQVKKALVAATCNRKFRGSEWLNVWAELQKRLKNNDMEVSYANSSTVSTIHQWVREFDGKISHFIFTRNPGKGDDFLFKRYGRFERATQAYVFFASGMGSGTYHSVRGMGWRMFPMLQASNRFRNGILDGTSLSMALLIQPKADATLDAPPMTISGPVAYLSPEMELVQRGSLPNVAQAAMPVVQDLAMLIQNNTGSYRPRSNNPGGVQKTAAEVKGQMEIDSALTVSAVNQFYRSWTRLLREMFERVKKIGPKNKRFPEIAEFYKCCEERGVPPELIKQVRRVKAQRAIGLGSPQQRQLAFGEVFQMIGSLDEVGRNKLTRDMITNRMDRDAADRYKPRGEATRPVIDEKIAQLENADFREGQPIESQLGENHAVHATIHVGAMMDSVEVIGQLRDNPAGIDFEAAQKELQFLDICVAHTGPHIQEMAQDPTRREQASQMKQALQNIAGIADGFNRQMQRQIQNQQKQAALNADAQGTQVDPEETRKNQEHLLKLRQMQEVHQERMSMRAEDVAQKMELKKIQFDQKLGEDIHRSTLNSIEAQKKASQQVGR